VPRVRGLVLTSWLMAAGILLLAAVLGPQPGRTQPLAPVPAAPVPASPLKVAAILPSPANDLSWTQALHVGLQQLEREGRIEYAFTESVEPAAAERVLRRFAERHPDLIIAHSGTYKDAVFTVASQFPDLKFAWSSFGSRDTGPNVAAYDTPIWEASYLAGELAASVSKTGKLGFVGGLALPGCRAILNAFRSGAQRRRPELEPVPVYVGSFVDIAKAKALALSLADRGVDVMATCGNGPARGTIEAARERNVWVIGYVYDMTSLAPDHVLGSLVWDGYRGMRQLIDDVARGTFLPGKYYAATSREAITSFQLNAVAVPALPLGAVGTLERSRQELREGTLRIPISFQ